MGSTVQQWTHAGKFERSSAPRQLVSKTSKTNWFPLLSAPPRLQIISPNKLWRSDGDSPVPVLSPFSLSTEIDSLLTFINVICHQGRNTQRKTFASFPKTARFAWTLIGSKIRKFIWQDVFQTLKCSRYSCS